MKKSCSIILVLFLATLFARSQVSLKEQALEQFKAEHYHEAVATLKEALKSTPDDAELYYYLGFFSHYIGSDSRLYNAYNREYTEQILNYLDMAISLKPDYGDAKYFYGAECSTVAFQGMQNRDLPLVKSFMKRAYDKGAFPKWLVEFGKNILNSCEPGSILFAAGDADFNVCLYLQVVEGFRPDITLLPIGNIDRPWYIQYIKEGFDGVTPKVNISLSDNQIGQIRPFKWKTTTIDIDVSDKDKERYQLPTDFKMQWEIAPDYTSYRMHSKIEGEEEQARTYLSPQRAMLLEIIENNMSGRPIYFTNFADPTFYGGLKKYFTNCGYVSRLSPITTADTDYARDYTVYERLLREDNFADYHTIKPDIIPRIYRVSYYTNLFSVRDLANHYKETGDNQKLENLHKLFSNKLKMGFNAEYEEELEKIFEKNS